MKPSSHSIDHSLLQVAMALVGSGPTLSESDIQLGVAELTYARGERARGIVRLLAGSSRSEVRVALARVILRGSEPELRTEAVTAAGLDAGFPIEPLVRAAADTHAAVRYAAMHALAELEGGLVQAAVRARIVDVDESVAALARETCAARGWDPTPPRLPAQFQARLATRRVRLVAVSTRLFEALVVRATAELETLAQEARAWIPEILNPRRRLAHLGTSHGTRSIKGEVFWDRPWESLPAELRGRDGKQRNPPVRVEDLVFDGPDLVGTLVIQSAAWGPLLLGGFSMIRLGSGTCRLELAPIQLLGEVGEELRVPFRHAMGAPSRSPLMLPDSTDIEVDLYPPDWCAAGTSWAETSG